MQRESMENVTEVLVQLSPSACSGEVPFETYADERLRENEIVTLRLEHGCLVVERSVTAPPVGI